MHFLGGMKEAKDLMAEGRQTLDSLHMLSESLQRGFRYPRGMSGMGASTTDANYIDFGNTPAPTPAPASTDAAAWDPQLFPITPPSTTPAPVPMTTAQAINSGQPSVWGSITQATSDLPQTIGTAVDTTGNVIAATGSAIANAVPTIWTAVVIGVAVLAYIELSKASRD